MSRTDQIGRQPREHEIKEIVAAKVTGRGAPEGTMSQDSHPVWAGLLSVWQDAAATRHPLSPGWKPHKAEYSDADEDGTPAESRHQNTCPECAHGVSESHC